MNIKLTTFQDDFIFSEAKFPAMISAWGTGKTMSAIIKICNLAEKYPNSLIAVFRKEFVDLRDSAIKDFKAYTGRELDSQRNVTIGSSVIMFRHLEELNNIQNMNLSAIWIEQAEELPTNDIFLTLFGRLRRKIAGYPDYVQQLILTANANGHDWIWELYFNGGFSAIEKTLREKGLLPDNVPLFSCTTATSFDNKDNLPAGFWANVEIVKQLKPKMYNRLVMNSFDDSDAIDRFISPEYIDRAEKKPAIVSSKRVITIDPARYGDDQFQVYCMQGTNIIDELTLEKISATQAIGEIVEFSKRVNCRNICGDACGLGGPYFDRLEELGFNVFPLDSSSTEYGEEEEIPEKYLNLRAYMWDEASISFASGKVYLSWQDSELKKELCCVKYRFKGSKMAAESKDDIRSPKRLGHSPNKADAYIYGLFAQNHWNKINSSYEDNSDDAALWQPKYTRRGY